VLGKAKQNVTLPLLPELREVKYVKETRLLLYNKSFDEAEYTGVDFLRPVFQVTSFTDTHTKPRGISSAKKTGIVNLLNASDTAERKFWLDLLEDDAQNDVVDNAE